MKMLKSSFKRTALLLAIICILSIGIFAAPASAHNRNHQYIGVGEKYNIQTTYQYIDSNYHKETQTGLIRYPMYNFHNGNWHFSGYLSDEDSFSTGGYLLPHRVNPQTGRCEDCGYQIWNYYQNQWNIYGNNNYYWDGRNQNGPPSIPPPPRP